MRPLVTAHSGCEKTAPNSTESVLTAARLGADSAEVDVRITLDMVPVLSHDDLFPARRHGEEAAPSGTRISIAASLLKELKGIVTLEEVILRAKDKGIILNLDIKDFNPACIKGVMDLLEKHDAQRHSLFSGFSPEQVIDARKTYPAAGFMVNVSEEFVSKEVISLYKSSLDSFIDTLTDIYRKTGGICLNMSRNYCTTPVAQSLAKRFVPVSVWTVDDEAQMRMLAESGVYSITTRNVEQLVRILD